MAGAEAQEHPTLGRHGCKSLDKCTVAYGTNANLHMSNYSICETLHSHKKGGGRAIIKMHMSPTMFSTKDGSGPSAGRGR